MKKYQMTEDSINQVLAYLGTRPYTEVSQLITLLFQSAQLVEGSDEADALIGKDEEKVEVELTEKGA